MFFVILWLETVLIFWFEFSKLRLKIIELNLNLEAINSSSDNKALVKKLNVKLR